MNIIIYASNDERVNKVAIRVGINERISKQDKVFVVAKDDITTSIEFYVKARVIELISYDEAFYIDGDKTIIDVANLKSIDLPIKDSKASEDFIKKLPLAKKGMIDTFNM